MDARVSAEVDELLCSMKAERQLERITTRSSADVPHIMTKEDCMTLFRATGVPPSGPLWGVYRWAADLDKAKYNFEDEVEGDDYSFMNVYD